jgi:hypothetical protein
MNASGNPIAKPAIKAIMEMEKVRGNPPRR